MSTRNPLDKKVLRYAYANGYFPMPDPDTGEILWYQPNPRAVIPLEQFHAARSLRRTKRRDSYRVSRDEAFADVMRGCAERPDTWITEEFMSAYTALHDDGDAHSVEVWDGDRLVGGLYGVAIGGAFFAESKFHRVTDASKLALWHLVDHMRATGMTLLEVQFITPHLASLGATLISHEEYMEKLAAAIRQKISF